MSRFLIPLGAVLVLSTMQANASDQPQVSRAPASAATSHDERVQHLVSKIRKSLRFLKGATFDMGDWGKETEGRYYDFDTYSRPLHKVTLDSFSMMAYKVTYDDFDVFTDAIGKERIAASSWLAEFRAPKRPAGVSWFGAKDFCQWLGKLTHLPFDLPTEAQWEYAARSGGRKVIFSTTNGKIERGKNFPAEWVDGPKPPLSDVGSFPPNPSGLYGMSEDTGEWVNDWFDAEYYKRSPRKNPTGPASGTEKVLRGSVGGRAEIAAAVFMRTKYVPQPLTEAYPEGSRGPEVKVPFPGYSGSPSQTFRCVVNKEANVR